MSTVSCAYRLAGDNMDPKPCSYCKVPVMDYAGGECGMCDNRMCMLSTVDKNKVGMPYCSAAFMY